MTPENTRLVKLRGGLDPVEVGARAIESLARNVPCTRLRALVVCGLTPTEVVKTVFGLRPDAMSPFTLGVTQSFRRRLQKNGGAELLAAYRAADALTVVEARVVDVETLAPGDSVLARRTREAETRRLIGLKAAGDPLAPNLILNPRLMLRIVGVDHAVEFDHLVAADAETFYRVGVVKSYADRGGKTDRSHLRAACREGAVGILALRQLMEVAGAHPELVGDRLDLVLRAPGSFQPSLSLSMRVQSELASVERALASAPADLVEIEQLVTEEAGLSDPRTIERLPNNYRSSCKEHCALADRCRAQALQQGQPVILGDTAADQLAPAGSLNRAFDLLQGRGRGPANQAEATLRAELRAADALLDRIAHG